jgi:hypothetical protein
MSKRLSLLLLIVIVSVSTTYSQRMQRNNIVLWGSGGYSTFIGNADKLTSVGNIGAEIGIGYELSINKFIVQTGVGYRYSKASLQLQDSLHNLMLVDSEGDIFRGYFEFSKNNDTYQMGHIIIPLLAGMKFDKFYFLAGGKVGINISTTSTHSSNIRSYADYAQFINVFENMPNHGLLTWKEKNSYSLKFTPNYMASVELGYLFKSKPSKKLSMSYRIAAFADYGINKIKTTSGVDQDLILSKSPTVYQPYLNSILLSQDHKNAVFNPLFVGIKFTAVFGLSNSHKCMCEDY